jgi:hypothetical protein
MNSTTQTDGSLLADYRWLVGPEAENWLSEAQEAACNSGAESLVRLADRFRKQLSPGRVHLVLEQAELRHKAREKFPGALRMFFTPTGLEQATDHWVAAYKAARFLSGEPMADLCCGIGGDLLALAARGPVRAIDRNPATAILADANAQALRDCGTADIQSTEVITSDVADVSLADVAAWHIDPDRRPFGRRTTKVSLHEPGPAVLARLLADCPHAAIKLAPAAEFDEPWWANAELEWISRGRQCRQLVAWFGRLAKNPGQRRATVINSTAINNVAGIEPTVAASFVGSAEIACPVATKIGRYVFEPDAAVLAAKLEGALAVDQKLSAVAEGVAYFTADYTAENPALASFEVLETMPYQVKALRQWLAARNIGRLEVKKRGVPLEPDAVHRQLQARGDGDAVILLARLNGRITAIIARRIKG